jgi:excisionase family DNA binding protein
VTVRLLTAREVAERLGLSVETVLRWAKRGEFVGVVIYLSSRAIRFREGKLDEWIEQRATPRRGVLPTLPDAARPAPYSLASTALPTDDDEET